MSLHGNNKKYVVVLAAIFTMLFMLAAGANAWWIFGSGKRSEKVHYSGSIMLFPFDTDSVANLPDDFGDQMVDSLSSYFAEKSSLFVVPFDTRLSTIQRATEDNTLKSQDVKPPFYDGSDKAARIAGIAGADYYLVGSIDQYQISNEGENRTARIILSAQLVETSTEKVLNVMQITGSKTGSGYVEKELRGMAGGDAVVKLVDDLVRIMHPEKYQLIDEAPVLPAKEDDSPDADTKSEDQPSESPAAPDSSDDNAGKPSGPENGDDNAPKPPAPAPPAPAPDDEPAPPPAPGN